MQEGTVVRWLKAVGDRVDIGEPVAEIETDKAVVEFESIAAGVLGNILVTEGTTVPVGQPIALLAAEGEDLPEAPPAAEAPALAAEASDAAQPEPVPTAAPPAEAETPPEPPREVRASPIARRLADERGIDLGTVNGTGPGGRITRDDILAFEATQRAAATTAETSQPEPSPEPEETPDAPESEPEPPPEAPSVATPEVPPALEPPPAPTEAPAAPTGPGEKVPLTRMRQQIARVTVRSKQQTPHFYVSAEIDMTQAMETRRQLNSTVTDKDSHVSVNDPIIKACVGALKKYPKFNAYFADDGIQMNEAINVGIAIASEEGLIVPAILDCGSKSLLEIARASKDLIERSKSGTLHPREYTGGTFSISNLGMFEVSGFAAIIQPPQSAVLAVGTVTRKPVARNDELAVADMLTATVSVDHRVSDGAEGAQFLVEVKQLLENPASLLL